MNSSRRSFTVLIAISMVLGLVGAVASTAVAEKKTKSVKTEAKWVSFDQESKTITVKVRKAGRGNTDKGVKAGRKVVWNVKPEGSVLTRTTVAVNGRKAELVDITEGRTVNIYWIPDPSGEGRFARKIDVVMSQEEWLEKTKDNE